MFKQLERELGIIASFRFFKWQVNVVRDFSDIRVGVCYMRECFILHLLFVQLVFINISTILSKLHEIMLQGEPEEPVIH